MMIALIPRQRNILFQKIQLRISMSSLSNNYAFYTFRSCQRLISQSLESDRQTDGRTNCRPIKAPLQISFSINKPLDLWHDTVHNVILIIVFYYKIFLLLSYLIRIIIIIIIIANVRIGNDTEYDDNTIVNHATLSEQKTRTDNRYTTTSIYLCTRIIINH